MDDLPNLVGAAKSRYDYVLIYKNVKLAVVEAKKSGMSYGDAVGQVKDYNEQLKNL